MRPVNRPALCAACDYDLRGIRGGGMPRCPECGQPASGPSVAGVRERTVLRRLARRLVIALITVTVIGTAALVILPQHAVILAPLLVFIIGPLAPAVIAAYTVRVMPEE